MNPKHLRIRAALVLFGFLLVFFVPSVYDATMFRCTGPSFLCPSDPSGLKSLGYSLFHWGGAYSFGGAGNPQVLGYTFLPEGYFALPDGSSLTPFGVLLFIAFPIAVACVGLLAPEVVRRSRVTRTGFIAFGAFVLVLSAFFFVSMISEGFDPALALLGAVLAPTGGAMVTYGLRLWMFHIDHTA